MSPEALAAEKRRFNALSREDAQRIADEVEGAENALRSCWYCNPAHEHLKSLDYFTCFACGLRYVRGYPVEIVAMRMQGTEVTDETISDFAKCLDSDAKDQAEPG